MQDSQAIVAQAIELLGQDEAIHWLAAWLVHPLHVLDEHTPLQALTDPVLKVKLQGLLLRGDYGVHKTCPLTTKCAELFVEHLEVAPLRGGI